MSIITMLRFMIFFWFVGVHFCPCNNHKLFVSLVASRLHIDSHPNSRIKCKSGSQLSLKRTEICQEKNSTDSCLARYSNNELQKANQCLFWTKDKPSFAQAVKPATLPCQNTHICVYAMDKSIEYNKPFLRKEKISTTMFSNMVCVFLCRAAQL